jgi:Tol biopolymer transport system component
VPGANGKIAFNSPRGCPAYFGCSSGNLYTIEPDGRSEAQLLPEEASDPAWSPDGRRLAFRALDPALHSFYIAVMNADGTDRRALDPPREPNSHDTEPAWSPDGKKIAFTRFVPGAGFFGLFEIFTMTADGEGATNLTHDDPYANSFGSYEPAWSPDGKKIAFTRTVHSDSVSTDSEIFLMNADGSGVQRLTHNDTSFVQPTDSSPTWSPDGSRIAFSSFRNGSFDIYTMRADGSDLRKVTGEGPDHYPSWSPDGTKIAFANQRAEYGGYEISVVNSDGSNEVRVTHSGGSNSLKPDWQPLNRPPDCSAARASPGSLWPPNKRFVTVTVAGAGDPDGDPVAITVTGVTSDESATGDIARGPGASQVTLRARRDGSGDGRVYTIAFRASDGAGGECTGSATVTVPHSQ